MIDTVWANMGYFWYYFNFSLNYFHPIHEDQPIFSTDYLYNNARFYLQIRGNQLRWLSRNHAAKLTWRRPQKRAKMFFYQIIKSHEAFEIREHVLRIHSYNQKYYSMNLKTGIVKDSTAKLVCISVSRGYSLPFYDLLLIKALVLAYAPHLLRNSRRNAQSQDIAFHHRFPLTNAHYFSRVRL
ncbi:MAG: hypothetical protein ACTSQI_15495 [Candidatus Helarchaeota archaeon]